MSRYQRYEETKSAKLEKQAFDMGYAYMTGKTMYTEEAKHVTVVDIQRYLDTTFFGNLFTRPEVKKLIAKGVKFALDYGKPLPCRVQPEQEPITYGSRKPKAWQGWTEPRKQVQVNDIWPPEAREPYMFHITIRSTQA